MCDTWVDAGAGAGGEAAGGPPGVSDLPDPRRRRRRWRRGSAGGLTPLQPPALPAPAPEAPGVRRGFWRMKNDRRGFRRRRRRNSGGFEVRYLVKLDTKPVFSTKFSPDYKKISQKCSFTVKLDYFVI